MLRHISPSKLLDLFAPFFLQTWAVVVLFALILFSGMSGEAFSQATDTLPSYSIDLEPEADPGPEFGEGEETVTSPSPEVQPSAQPKAVYVIPVGEVISTPTLYIIRRALKQAMGEGISALVLDMNTPGGRLDTTLEIMQILDRFEGETLTYVNIDAISAGAFIASATDEIFFAPKSQIGAAAVILGTGQEVPETAKKKIESYLRAKVRNYTETDPYRAQVIRAMMDADYALEIDGEVIKPEGELLTLTAEEANKEYGEPPRPLLGAGIVDSLEELLDRKYGPGNYTINEFKISWSELLAQYMETIAPILLGIGFLCLMIEFKTPGFGFIGITGIILLLIVFASNYVAGLAGHEPILFFILGLLLIGVELFLLPGTVFPALFGILLILGSLIWSMADIWPTDKFEFDPDLLWQPFYKMLLGLAIATVGAVAVWHFLPQSWIYDKLVLTGQGAPPDPVTAGGGSSLNANHELPMVGAKGVTVTDLHPAGEVEIDGKRYQATLGLGTLERGMPVVVVGYKNFALLVDKVAS